MMNEFKNNTFIELARLLNISADSLDIGKIAGINDVFMNDLFSNRALPNMSVRLRDNITYIYNMNLYYTYFGGETQRRFISTPFLNEIFGVFKLFKDIL